MPCKPGWWKTSLDNRRVISVRLMMTWSPRQTTRPSAQSAGRRLNGAARGSLPISSGWLLAAMAEPVNSGSHSRSAEFGNHLSDHGRMETFGRICRSPAPPCSTEYGIPAGGRATIRRAEDASLRVLDRRALAAVCGRRCLHRECGRNHNGTATQRRMIHLNGPSCSSSSCLTDFVVNSVRSAEKRRLARAADDADDTAVAPPCLGVRLSLQSRSQRRGAETPQEGPLADGLSLDSPSLWQSRRKSRPGRSCENLSSQGRQSSGAGRSALAAVSASSASDLGR